MRLARDWLKSKHFIVAPAKAGAQGQPRVTVPGFPLLSLSKGAGMTTMFPIETIAL